MDARELIHELVDCEMDASVEIVIKQQGEEEELTSISFESKRIWENDYARLIVDIDSRVIVEKATLDRMEEQIDGLESEVEMLRDMLAEQQK